MLEKLMNNPYAWGILAFCTIFSVVYGIWSNCKSKQKKELSCYRNSFNVVRAGKSLIPELELKYNGKEIPELVITKYAIWNSGNEVLRNSDIVEAKPLEIMCDKNEAQILDAKIIQCSDDDNKFRITNVDEENVVINFDYANVKEGIIVQVMHTGEAKNIKVACKIKGGKKVKSYNVDKESKMNKRVLNGITFGIGIFFFVVVLLLLIVVIINSICLGEVSFENKITILFLCLYSVVMAVMYRRLLKEVYYIDIPVSIRNAIGYDEINK